jgi:hypothetical protein
MVSLLDEVTFRDGPVGPVGLRVRCADGGWRQVESVAENLLEDPVVRAIVVKSRDVANRPEELSADTFADGNSALPSGATTPDPSLPSRPTFAHR